MSQLFPAGGARIARGMFAYVSVMAALATLSPFDFQLVPEREFAVLWLFNDVLINLLLLFPVGFLFALAFEGRVGPRGLHALWFGLAFSLCLEYAQQFLPSC
jgi:glycopeptide antibiotics resistance protein